MHKAPLFRKENTTAHRPNVHTGGEFRDERRSKKEAGSEAMRRPMSGKERRGRDYTPLFKFLLSRVGSPWNEVHAEAVRRLDTPEPIFWLVALDEDKRMGHVRVGESSYYSGLFVDPQGLLQRVDPAIGPSSLVPLCRCCTHTFNGTRFTRLFEGLRSTVEIDSVPAPPADA